MFIVEVLLMTLVVLLYEPEARAIKPWGGVFSLGFIILLCALVVGGLHGFFWGATELWNRVAPETWAGPPWWWA